jgi:hypothetical protein
MMIAKIVGNVALAVCVGLIGLAALFTVLAGLNVDYFMYALSRVPMLMG